MKNTLNAQLIHSKSHKNKNVNSINFLNLESKIINLLLPNFACQHLFNHVIPVNVNTWVWAFEIVRIHIKIHSILVSFLYM